MKKAPVYLGIFLIAAATLMLEILFARIVSVQAWYHLAFFIISLAMLGMTAGALVVFLIPSAFPPEKIGRRLAQASLGFALSVPFSLGFVLASPLLPVGDLLTFFGLLGPGAALALPFTFAGLALTLALTRAELPAGVAYGVDLLGAATGCVLIIPVLDNLDAPSAALAAAAVGALGSAAFAVGTGRRGVAVACAVGGVALFALAGGNATLSPSPLRPGWVKGNLESPDAFTFVRWNTHSRITVGPSRNATPFYWGLGENVPREILARPVEQRHLVVDGLAATTMQRAPSTPQESELLPWDVTQFVHHLRPRGPAAVIGVGGGRDVLAAVRAGHESVLGLEINKTIVDLHRGPMADFSGLTRLPGVTLVQDEARSFMARDRGRYTVINMPMIDTWAATGAGAFSLSENGLYTVEAWKVFLSRLAPDGIFTVSRWYVEDSTGEAIRLVALAYDTLFHLGVGAPERHIVVVRGGWVATMLLSASPFSDADLSLIDAHMARLGLTTLVHPRRPAALPPLTEIARCKSSAELRQWADAQPLDYRAPTDERPFFFNLVRPGSWLTGKGTLSARLAYGGNLQATRTLVFATLASSVLAVLALLVPLGVRRANLGHLSRAEIAAALSYFALIGLGFMFVELGLLSRLSVFLGHPTLALAVLLAGIILFAGVGSLLSGRLRIEGSPRAMLYPLAPAALLVLIAPVMSRLMEATAGATTPVRIAIGVLLIAPPAIGLGFGFPIGLRLVQRIEAGRGARPDSIGPWLWGINGACGVSASGLGLACSMAFGVSTTILVGAACYALLALVALRLHRAGRSRV